MEKIRIFRILELNSKNSKFWAWKKIRIFRILELNSKKYKNSINSRNFKLKFVQLPQIQLWILRILKILNLELGQIFEVLEF